MSVPWNEVVDIATLTLGISVAATLAGAAIGIPLGAALGTRPRHAHALFRTIIYTLYSLPPVVAGLAVYLLLGREGPLGALGLLFTPTAIVIAETLLAAPLIAGLTVAALADVPREVREAVHASGAPPTLARWTLVKEARIGIMAGVMVGMGRTLAEVAAALLVGGNVRHETRTLGTAILQEVNRGDYAFAFALAGVLLALALLTVVALARLQTIDAGGRA